MGDIDEIMALIDKLSTIIPKGEFPDNITVNSKEDLIEAIRYFVNKAYLTTTVHYHKYEIEVFKQEFPSKISYGFPSKISYGYQIFDCENDRYVYCHKYFESKDLAIENAKEVINGVN